MRLVAFVPAEDARQLTGVRTMEHEGVAAVLAPDPPRDTTDVAALLHDAAVVSALLPTCSAVLPVNLRGAGVEPEDVGQVLGERAAELRGSLDRLRGAVELGIRAQRPTRTATKAADGRSYLAGRAAAWSWVRPFVEQVEALRGVAGVRDVVVLAQGADLVKASLLVDATRVADVSRYVGLRLRPPGGIDVVCSGPFAPYSFARHPTEARA